MFLSSFVLWSRDTKLGLPSRERHHPIFILKLHSDIICRRDRKGRAVMAWRHVNYSPLRQVLMEVYINMVGMEAKVGVSKREEKKLK